MVRFAWVSVVPMLLVASAQAQPEVAAQVPPAPVGSELPVGQSALPGGLVVADAAVLPAGRFGLMGLAGFGYRDEVLDAGDRLRRGVASLGLSYAPVRSFAFGLSLDGRYDSHSSGDDGYVGDPRLFLRLALGRRRLSYGAQLTVWVPGKEAPSFAFDATSVEARALLSAALGPATASLNLGARLDNSDSSVDDPRSLSPQDQVSLGVSAYHAAVAGARVFMPLGRGFISGEAAAEVFLGDGAPDATVRALAAAGVRIAPSVSLLGYLQLASAPDARAAMMAQQPLPLVPYETAVTFGLGLETRFGGEAPPPSRNVVTVEPLVQPEPPAQPKRAELAGAVLDDAGAPVAGAKVELVRDGKVVATIATDAKGKYKLPDLAPGPATLRVAMPGKEPHETPVELVAGANAAPKVQLDPELPPGELRGNVRTRVGGKPIAGAAVAVAPGGHTTVTGADGSFAFEVPPGKYTITTTAEGYAPQQIEAVVDQDGVTVKFINLDKPKK